LEKSCFIQRKTIELRIQQKALLPDFYICFEENRSDMVMKIFNFP